MSHPVTVALADCAIRFRGRVSGKSRERQSCIHGLWQKVRRELGQRGRGTTMIRRMSHGECRRRHWVIEELDERPLATGFGNSNKAASGRTTPVGSQTRVPCMERKSDWRALGGRELLSTYPCQLRSIPSLLTAQSLLAVGTHFGSGLVSYAQAK